MKLAACIECHATIEYKTNKPKRCLSCREKRDKKFAKYRVKLKRPSRSKKEGQMQKVLNQLFPNATYIDNGYYSWMLSPKGAPLQLDRYYPDLNLAFEYNGKQHYEFNYYMHKDEESFRYLQACDRRKQLACRRQGITLIVIKYTKQITKEYILKRLEQADVLKDIQKKTQINR